MLELWTVKKDDDEVLLDLMIYRARICLETVNVFRVYTENKGQIVTIGLVSNQGMVGMLFRSYGGVPDKLVELIKIMQPVICCDRNGDSDRLTRKEERHWGARALLKEVRL